MGIRIAAATLAATFALAACGAQTRPAAAADRWVATRAAPASAWAARALPALKPYQPTHSMPAPIMVMPGLCGGDRSRG